MGFPIVDHRDGQVLALDWLEERLARLLAELGVADRRLEVALVDDAGITALNRRFFHRDRPTNVISFPAGDDPASLGELIVSVDTARRETEPLGYSPEEGVLYYLVHGLLHLVGYEHVGVPEAAAAAMAARQEELFAALLDPGCGDGRER